MTGDSWISPGRVEFRSSTASNTLCSDEDGDGEGGYLFGGDGVDDLGGGGGRGASSDVVDNEKRRPKTNLQQRNSEILLSKKPKSNAGKKQQVNVEAALKECAALLSKLMKHQYGWVFNKPVDAKGLGLHDYFSIIKHPMDLGTIKSRLSKGRYKSPRAFAEDVRLTFRNAMTYNPEGQDVHVMAKELLKVFEDQWAVLESGYNLKPRKNFDDDGEGERYPGPRRFNAEEDVRNSLAPSRRLGKEDAGHSAAASRRFDGEEAARSAVPARRFNKDEMGHSTATPHKVRKSPPPELKRTLDRSESTTLPSNVRPVVPVSYTPTGRVAVPKKPKAKDPNKRDMTYEEKQRLSTNLINLPPEKLDNIVQIIKKRNSELSQHDDEIEVDIDSFDVETLWELDRFVTNYKKSLSKNKKKNGLASQAKEENANNNVQEVTSQDPVPSEAEPPQESSKDEKNVATSLPVEGEKQGDNASRSSSSSSSSSDSGSSSDSDSESSSASGSDAAHSPRT